MTTTYLLAGGRRVRAHPAADVFPLLSKDEITVLAADIQTHGQRLPVLLQRADDGADLVLDGRNRLLACEEAGLEPLVAEVEPAVEAVRLIVSVNLVRRHQGDSQRAMSAARLVNLARGRPAQIASIDAISQVRAAGLLGVSRATVQRAVAILHDPILAPAVDAGEVAVSDAFAIRHESDEARRRALATVTAGSARTLRGALEREAAGPATVGLEPPPDHARASADAVTRFASATPALGSERPVVRSAAGSPGEREVAETSTAGATDAEAHRPVASEPSGSEAADPAGGSTLSASGSSGDSGSGGRTAAERDPKWGGADSSPDPSPLLPAPAPVVGREVADAHVRGVDVATAGQTGCDADAERRGPTSGSTDSGASDDAAATDAAVGGAPSEATPSSDSKSGGGAMAVRGGECGQPPAGPAGGVGGADSSPDSAPLPPAAVVGHEAADAQGVDAATAGQTAGDADAELRRCLTELRSAAARLGTVSLGRSSRVEAACGLVQALVAAMERWLDSGRDEQVLVAGLPAALAPSLDALSTPIGHGSPPTEDGGDADGRGRGSAPLEQASNAAGWLKTRFGWNRRSQQ